MERALQETKSDSQKDYYESFMSNIPCQECNGKHSKEVSG